MHKTNKKRRSLLIENRKFWRYSEISKIGLQKDDAKFLSQIGLKLGNFGCIDIYSDFELNQGVVIAYDNDFPIVCSNTSKGLFLLENDLNRFVNSTVKQFEESISRFKLYCDEVTNLDDNMAKELINTTIEDMKAIDLEAWNNINFYWPIIAQQMYEGNF